MRGESKQAYWARQLSFATVFGALTFIAAFLGGCLGLLSYLNYVHPGGKSNTPIAFFRSLGIACVVSVLVFAVVLWRGYVRRKGELADPDQ